MTLIFQYCRHVICRYKTVFLRALAMMLFMTMLNSLVPFGMRYLLDQAAQKGSYLFLIQGLVIFGIYLTLKTAANILWYILLDEFGGKYITDLSVSLEERLAKASQSYIDREQTGRLKHTMYADVLDVFRVVAHNIPSLLSSVAVILICLALAAVYDFKLCLFIAAALAVGLFVTFFSRNMIALKAGATNQKLKVFHAFCDNYVDSLPLVQTNPVLGYFREKTGFHINDFIRTSQKEDKVQIFWSEAISNYNTLFTLALSALLSFPAAGGSVVDLVFFMALSDIVMSEGQQAELLLQQIVSHQPAFENIDRVLTLPARQGKETLSVVREIVFDQVCFSYGEEGEPVLRQADYVFQEGECVRLTGKNGSGKSTFIKLLCGLYTPVSGEIRINGAPLSQWSLESLQEQILYINQDETLLNETFRTYLELMNGSALSPEDTKRLLEQVHLEDPERKIENNGMTLSVGQRKKLLILKLFLRWERASVIILDELEAGLDQNTRRMYRNFLSNLSRQRQKLILVIEHEEDLPDFDRVIDLGRP